MRPVVQLLIDVLKELLAIFRRDPGRHLFCNGMFLDVNIENVSVAAYRGLFDVALVIGRDGQPPIKPWEIVVLDKVD